MYIMLDESSYTGHILRVTKDHAVGLWLHVTHYVIQNRSCCMTQVTHDALCESQYLMTQVTCDTLCESKWIMFYDSGYMGYIL
jgi:hypothetical protein